MQTCMQLQYVHFSTQAPVLTLSLLTTIKVPQWAVMNMAACLCYALADTRPIPA